MKYTVVRTALFLMTLIWVMPSYADTDQHCLKLCVENGGTANVCLPQCTYGETISTLPKPPATHRVLETLTPLDDGQIVPPKPPAPPLPNIDHACLADCLHVSGTAYQMCAEHCTKPQCPPGSATLCLNLTGVNPIAPPVAPNLTSILTPTPIVPAH